MNRCHFVNDEDAGKVLIPNCWSVVISNDIEDCTCNNSNHKLNAQTAETMKEAKKQSKIVKQRLFYHFKSTQGGWNIEGMNAPFMKEFLNEVERLCDAVDNTQKVDDGNVYYRVKRECITPSLKERFPTIQSWSFEKEWWIENNIAKESELEPIK